VGKDQFGKRGLAAICFQPALQPTSRIVIFSACPETPLPLGGAGRGKDNLLISFTPTPALPQREREYRNFRTGTAIYESWREGIISLCEPRSFVDADLSSQRKQFVVDTSVFQVNRLAAGQRKHSFRTPGEAFQLQY